MADPKAADSEPSIEEILASIREIISDDTFDSKKPAPSAAAAPAPSADDKELMDILDLENSVDDKPAPQEKAAEEMPSFDSTPDTSIDFTDSTAELLHEPEPKEPDLTIPEEEPQPVAEKPMRPAPIAASLLADTARDAARAHIAKLAANIAVTRTGHGVTLEDLVRDMLTPMLKDWLDENLPPMIERLVAREIEKLVGEARL